MCEPGPVPSGGPESEAVGRNRRSRVISFALEGGVDPVVGWSQRIFLAAVFARAAYGKLRAPRAFAEAIRGYAVLPDSTAIAGSAAFGLLTLEAVVVVGLLSSDWASAASLVAAGLLLIYSAAIGLNLARGRRDIDCGCAGAGGRTALHEWLLARNGLYVAMAACAALPLAARNLLWLDAITIGLAVLSLGTLAVAFDGLAALATGLRRGELRR